MTPVLSMLYYQLQADDAKQGNQRAQAPAEDLRDSGEVLAARCDSRLNVSAEQCIQKCRRAALEVAADVSVNRDCLANGASFDFLPDWILLQRAAWRPPSFSLKKPNNGA